VTDRRDLFAAVWFTDYAGIGYIFDGRDWSVFPLFKSKTEAEKIWMEFIEPLSEKNLRMRFIELNGEYKFILYPFPLSSQVPNFGFYRSLASSETYRVFKSRFKGEALFRFGVLDEGNPTMMRRAKLVTDIKFIKSSEVKKDSMEWIAEEVQRKARKQNERDRGLIV
jgi:hypothetical protein